SLIVGGQLFVTNMPREEYVIRKLQPGRKFLQLRFHRSSPPDNKEGLRVCGDNELEGMQQGVNSHPGSEPADGQEYRPVDRETELRADQTTVHGRTKPLYVDCAGNDPHALLV